MANIALILIDIQNIYFTEGVYLLRKPEVAAQQAKKVLDEFRKRSLPVIHVKHLFHTEKYTEPEEYLIDFYPEVKPSVNEKIVIKRYPNAFHQTDLLKYLQSLDISHLVITGMMSHMCIDTTVRACQTYGFKVIVIDDACTTKALERKGEVIDALTVHNTFMASLDGMFATITSADEFILRM